jgi:TPR repeat protein
MTTRALMTGLAVLLAVSRLAAQSHPDSPVFKDKKPPERIPAIEPGNPVWEVSQAFITARKAATGDPLAQNELGARYLLGRGVEPDTAKAAYWIALAAGQNVLGARFNLAILLYHGWGVPWNPFQAFQQFRLCADLGMQEAQFALSQFYTENLVVPRNDSTALAWVERAAGEGYPPARDALPEFRKLAEESRKAGQHQEKDGDRRSILVNADTAVTGSDHLLLSSSLRDAPESVRRALGLSRYLEGDTAPDSSVLVLVHRAADAGSPEALTLLARLRERGEGGAPDTVEVLALLARAARLGSMRAPEHILRLIQTAGVTSMLRARSSRGDARARYALATLSGVGFEGELYTQQAYVTPEQGRELLAQAANAGYAAAQVELGVRYYGGIGVGADPERARALWRVAAAAGNREGAIRLAMTLLRDSLYTPSAREAVATLHAAAEEGSVLAEAALGYWYASALPPARDEGRSARHYRAAAMRGSLDALHALRGLHDALRPPAGEYQILP